VRLVASVTPMGIPSEAQHLSMMLPRLAAATLTGTISHVTQFSRWKQKAVRLMIG
jgi:hypothetical protein